MKQIEVCESCDGDRLWCGCDSAWGWPYVAGLVTGFATWVALLLLAGVW